MQKLKDKVAVITGGSSGIGLSAAKLFASEGAKVVIVGRNQDKLAKAKDEINNSAVLSIQADITRLTDIEKMYSKVNKKIGKIDILVANAGVVNSADVISVTEEFFDNIVNINYKGVYFTVQKAVSFLNRNSSVILISSVHAHMGIPGRSVYASTKAAVSQLARNFAADLSKRDIRINSVSPGFTRTPLLKNLSNEHLGRITDKIAMKKLATPEQIAQTVLFLASNESDYITGSDFIIDGGLSGVDQINI